MNASTISDIVEHQPLSLTIDGMYENWNPLSITVNSNMTRNHLEVQAQKAPDKKYW